MQKIRGFLAIIIIGVALAGGVTFATAIWQDTDWIDAGEIISAEKIRDNFDYLFSIAREDPPICTGDDALQWDGEEWGCTGGFSGDAILITEAHTQEEWIAEGGSMHETPDGYVCKMPASSCPAGWSQYQSWSTTGGRSCTGTQSISGNSGGISCNPTSCSTSSHAFSSAGTESCTYKNAYISEGAEMHYCSLVSQTCYATVTETGCI